MFTFTDEQIEALIDITALPAFQVTIILMMVTLYVGIWAWCEWDLARIKREQE